MALAGRVNVWKLVWWRGVVGLVRWRRRRQRPIRVMDLSPHLRRDIGLG